MMIGGRGGPEGLRKKIPLLLIFAAALVVSNIATFLYASQLSDRGCAHSRRLDVEHFLSNKQTALQYSKRAAALTGHGNNKSRSTDAQTSDVLSSNLKSYHVKTPRGIQRDTNLTNDPEILIEESFKKIAESEEENEVFANNPVYSCDCRKSVVTVYEQKNVESCKCPNVTQQSMLSQVQRYSYIENNVDVDRLKTIYVITPTYHRTTQKVDLTSMCHTLSLVPKLVWIIIEDSQNPTSIVTALIKRCRVKTVHLVVPTSSYYKVKKGEKGSNKPRGVNQRNAGLNWIRQHNTEENCCGVVYFGDDDNKYDIRLFNDIRATKTVSLWKVAWAGGLKWEGPICKNGRLDYWHSYAIKSRKFRIDMAGFAVDVCHLLRHPKARVGVDVQGHASKNGHLESDFLEHLAKPSSADCRGSDTEAYVWHSHTSSPSLHFEHKSPSGSKVEI